MNEMDENKEERSECLNNLEDLTKLRTGSIIWARLSKKGCFFIGMIMPWVPQIVYSENTWIVYWFSDREISKVHADNTVHFLKANYNSKVSFSYKGFDDALLVIQKQYSLALDRRLPRNLKELEVWIKDKSKFKLCNYEIPRFILEKVEEIGNNLPGGTKLGIPSDANNNHNLENCTQETAQITTSTEPCLGCRKFNKLKGRHCLFSGSLCIYCYDRVEKSLLVDSENTNTHDYCTICGWKLDFITCLDCFRVFCKVCVKYWFGEGMFASCVDNDLNWKCIFCIPNSDNISTIPCPLKVVNQTIFDCDSFPMKKNKEPVKVMDKCPKRAIRVLSLFDGISTGLLVLNKLGFKIEKYYASEIDNNAIQVSKANHGDAVQHIGDVKNITSETIGDYLPIHLVIGGSPCNDLSCVNHERKGLTDMQGSGALFFDFYRILALLEMIQGHPKNFFYLFENVSLMEHEHRATITRFLESSPVSLNASDYSAMNRNRLYWTNIPDVPDGKSPPKTEKSSILQEHLTPNLGRVARVNKIRTVTTNPNSLFRTDGSAQIDMNGKSSKPTTTELEKVFGFPEHYTDVLDLSVRARQALIGKSWSVPVVKAILEPLQEYFILTKEEEVGCKRKLEDVCFDHPSYNSFPKKNMMQKFILSEKKVACNKKEEVLSFYYSSDDDTPENNVLQKCLTSEPKLDSEKDQKCLTKEDELAFKKKLKSVVFDESTIDGSAEKNLLKFSECYRNVLSTCLINSQMSTRNTIF